MFDGGTLFYKLQFIVKSYFLDFFFADFLSLIYMCVCVCVRVCLFTYFVSELKEYLSFTLKCLAWTVYLFHYDVGRLEPLILGTSIMCSMLTCIMYSWFSYRCVNTLFLHLLYIYDIIFSVDFSFGNPFFFSFLRSNWKHVIVNLSVSLFGFHILCPYLISFFLHC